MCIKSNLNFVLNHERHSLKIYGYFTLVIFNVTSFFSVKMGYFWTFILEFKTLPAKTPWLVIYRWIQNFKQIMNSKLSFTKNDQANFDYPLTLKKKLVFNLFTISFLCMIYNITIAITKFTSQFAKCEAIF